MLSLLYCANDERQGTTYGSTSCIKTVDQAGIVYKQVIWPDEKERVRRDVAKQNGGRETLSRPGTPRLPKPSPTRVHERRMSCEQGRNARAPCLRSSSSSRQSPTFASPFCFSGSERAHKIEKTNPTPHNIAKTKKNMFFPKLALAVMALTTPVAALVDDEPTRYVSSFDFAAIDLDICSTRRWGLHTKELT